MRRKNKIPKVERDISSSTSLPESDNKSEPAPKQCELSVANARSSKTPSEETEYDYPTRRYDDQSNLSSKLAEEPVYEDFSGLVQDVKTDEKCYKIATLETDLYLPMDQANSISMSTGTTYNTFPKNGLNKKKINDAFSKTTSHSHTKTQTNEVLKHLSIQDEKGYKEDLYFSMDKSNVIITGSKYNTFPKQELNKTKLKETFRKTKSYLHSKSLTKEVPKHLRSQDAEKNTESDNHFHSSTDDTQNTIDSDTISKDGQIEYENITLGYKSDEVLDTVSDDGYINPNLLQLPEMDKSNEQQYHESDEDGTVELKTYTVNDISQNTLLTTGETKNVQGDIDRELSRNTKSDSMEKETISSKIEASSEPNFHLSMNPAGIITENTPQRCDNVFKHNSKITKLQSDISGPASLHASDNKSDEAPIKSQISVVDTDDSKMLDDEQLEYDDIACKFEEQSNVKFKEVDEPVYEEYSGLVQDLKMDEKGHKEDLYLPKDQQNVISASTRTKYNTFPKQGLNKKKIKDAFSKTKSLLRTKTKTNDVSTYLGRRNVVKNTAVEKHPHSATDANRVTTNSNTGSEDRQVEYDYITFGSKSNECLSLHTDDEYTDHFPNDSIVETSAAIGEAGSTIGEEQGVYEDIVNDYSNQLDSQVIYDDIDNTSIWPQGKMDNAMGTVGIHYSSDRRDDTTANSLSEGLETDNRNCEQVYEDVALTASQYLVVSSTIKQSMSKK